VLFDAAAAREVMRAYQQHGADIMIDLEHLSLDAESRSFDPDARAWCRLAIRGGELWAVDVRWTPDGQRRVKARTQRYVSPAFEADEKTRRVLRVLNIALTALPATHDPAALIAASNRARRRAWSETMDPKLIKDALDALEAGDSAKALEILKALIASAAGAEEPMEAEAPMEDPAALAAETPEEEPDAAVALADGEDEEDQMIAATVRALTGKKSAGEIRATLLGMRETGNAARTQATEIAELRQHVLRSELRELVRDNPTKIASPKLEKLVLSQRSVKEARALIDALPTVVAKPVSQKQKPADTEEIRLTEADREVAKLTGMDLAKVIEFKKAKAQRV